MKHRLEPLVKDMVEYAKEINRERHWLGDDAQVICSWADEIQAFIESEKKKSEKELKAGGLIT